MSQHNDVWELNIWLKSQWSKLQEASAAVERNEQSEDAIAQIEEGAKQQVQRLEGLHQAPDAVSQLCKIVAGQFQIIASLATLFGNTGALLSEVVGQQHVDREVLHDTRKR